MHDRQLHPLVKELSGLQALDKAALDQQASLYEERRTLDLQRL